MQQHGLELDLVLTIVNSIELDCLLHLAVTLIPGLFKILRSTCTYYIYINT